MNKILFAFIFFVLINGLSGCSSNIVKTTKSSNSSSRNAKNYKNNVAATYYADKFNGRKTANGTTFSNNKLTAAHRTLAFGTMVRVINLSNSRAVDVEINDRGPQKQSREIDLSKKAFMSITDNKNHGILKVKIQILN